MADQIKFIGLDKKKFSDPEHTADFLAAEQFNKKVYLGTLALYYKDLWRKKCVPYDAITRAYKGVSVVMPDDHPAIDGETPPQAGRPTAPQHLHQHR